MITNIQIKNYKSIDKLSLELGRINVFIGENGAGKSNILEVIALAGAASADKLDNEFLVSRGVRVTIPEHMRHAFESNNSEMPIELEMKDSFGNHGCFSLKNNNEPYSKWVADFRSDSRPNIEASTLLPILTEFAKKSKENNQEPANIKKQLNDFLTKVLASITELSEDSIKTSPTKTRKTRGKIFSTTVDLDENELSKFLSRTNFNRSPLAKEISNFIIYSPENSALRTFQKEGQIEPLGINGEGVLKLLSMYCDSEDKTVVEKIKKSLKMLGWFEDLKILEQNKEIRIGVRDRYTSESLNFFDYTSANEGFFFLLFYFLLFSSELTPSFFAVDNIDASLNPKLCEKLILELVKLSKANNKQTILTTHNPSILDGLNLDDEEQRLFVISRGRSGSTKIKRIVKPRDEDGVKRYRLSEMFLRGMLGGLPKGF